ncbi:hypothetical protein FRAHR75_1010004 [Frankia sp. Hr75.2]|nr:hypothetical protein FRAHR75_1010004 [Frankia sp. Hr75.2]
MRRPRGDAPHLEPGTEVTVSPPIHQTVGIERVFDAMTGGRGEQVTRERDHAKFTQSCISIRQSRVVAKMVSTDFLEP